MKIYNVQKITMDTYRYNLFKQGFERYGIDAETKNNPFGKLRLIRKIASVCGIIAPEVEKLYQKERLIMALLQSCDGIRTILSCYG